MIDVACPTDRKVGIKEEEKLEKYHDLAREIGKSWNVKVKVIPVVIAALGTVPRQLKNMMKEMGIPIKDAQIQMTVLFGTARIIRKVLEI